MTKYFYIYNPYQADFFQNAGLPVLTIGKGSKGDIYVKFLRDEKSEEVFTQWIQRKKKA